MGVTRRSRDNRIGPLLLVFCLLLAYSFNKVHHHEIQAEGINPVLAVLRDYTLVPLQNAGIKTGHIWKDCVTATFAGSRLARENDRLKDELISAQAQNRDLLAQQAENERLTQMLGLAQHTPTPLLAAQVLTLKPSPTQDTLTINRGLKDGVGPQSVILSPTGSLVGQVTDATSRSADVILITDQQSSVGAQITGGNGKTCVAVCQGTHSDLLNLTYLPVDADVKPGSRVVTSGLGGVFPKNVPIGVVVSVTTDQNRSMKTAVIRPDVDTNQMDDVFVRQ